MGQCGANKKDSSLVFNPFRQDLDHFHQNGILEDLYYKARRKEDYVR